MDQLIDLGFDASRDIQYSVNGRALKVRKMPLRLALKLTPPDDGTTVEVPAETMAEIISSCVRYADDGSAVYTIEQVLDEDFDKMAPLFQEVVGNLNPPDIGKNSVASLR